MSYSISKKVIVHLFEVKKNKTSLIAYFNFFNQVYPQKLKVLVSNDDYQKLKACIEVIDLNEYSISASVLNKMLIEINKQDIITLSSNLQYRILRAGLKNTMTIEHSSLTTDLIRFLLFNKLYFDMTNFGVLGIKISSSFLEKEVPKEFHNSGEGNDNWSIVPRSTSKTKKWRDYVEFKVLNDGNYLIYFGYRGERNNRTSAILASEIEQWHEYFGTEAFYSLNELLKEVKGEGEI